MASSRNNFITNNPILANPYSEYYPFKGHPLPITPTFLVTQDNDDIITEDGDLMITES